MNTDLLTRIRGELEERMAQLRPLLDEYERLSALASTLASTDAPAASPPGTPRARKRPLSQPGAARRGAQEAPLAAPADGGEPRRGPASPTGVQQAILAALEHGSHTASELVMVTAMGTREIRGGLSRLTGRGAIAKVKRRGDGRSAYALPPASPHA